MKLVKSSRLSLRLIQRILFSKRGYTSGYNCLSSDPATASSTAIDAWDYDVLINGGGIVGASLAADLLSNTDGALRIGIIEPAPVKPLKKDRSVPDIRVYAVSPKSISFLQRIGAWKYVENRSHPYKSMQIWEQSGPGLVKFHSKDLQVNELGRICEDSTIQSAIYEAIEEMGHKLDRISTHSIADLTFPTDSFQVDPVRVTLSPNKDVNAEKKQISTR
jgi:2-polyprenyl-6-methoxyphenol hydroxylase-like FAD-dependent oxidoreductase